MKASENSKEVSEKENFNKGLALSDNKYNSTIIKIVEIDKKKNREWRNKHQV